MKCHQGFVMSTNTFHDSCRHGSPDSNALFVRVAIATKDPNNILFVFIPVADPSSINLRVIRIENFWSHTPTVFKYFIAPGRQQPDMQSELGSLIYNEIHMLE